MNEHHEANIARHGGVSLATQALALFSTTGLSVGEIAVRLFGEDTITHRRQVHGLIDHARAEATKAH